MLRRCIMLSLKELGLSTSGNEVVEQFLGHN